nr:putative quinol monooxygenase [Anaerotruncus rubiinfantis]
MPRQQQEGLHVLVIVSKNCVLEGRKAEYLKLARELQEKSQAEDGNLEYLLYEDTRDENVLTFIEKWRDQAAIDRHNASEHFTRIVPQLGELKDKSRCDLRIYKAAEFR